MNFVIQGSAPLAADTEQTQDKLLGYPSRGTPAGEPAVIQVQQTWDGQGAVPPGWSSFRGSSRQHPTLPQYATPIDPESTPAMANGRRLRLNASEQAKMTADLAAAVAQLPGDWFPGGVTPANETRTK